MIFIRDKIYATVWKVEKFDKYIDLRVTTSEKTTDGKYVNSTWFPRMIGRTFTALKDTIKEGDTLIITKCKLSNEKYEDSAGNKKSRFKFIILEAEVKSKDTGNAPDHLGTPSPEIQNVAGDDDIPW